MSKRVCIVRQGDFPAETHVRKNVDALVDAGYTVDVICLREPGLPRREAYRGGIISRLPLKHRRGSKLRYLFEYAAFLLIATLLLTWRSVRRRYDIVEVYNLPDALVFSALPAKFCGSKVVFYMFELMPEQASDEFGMSAQHSLVRLLRWLEKRAVRMAHRVITVSPDQETLVVERDAPRVLPTVVLNVPEDDIFERRSDVRANGAFRIVTHGSILRRYGIQTLIRATPHIARAIPNAEVRIAGTGEYQEELEHLALELGVQDRVRFLGWFPHEAIPRIIEQAEVGIVATLLPRLLPNKLFEYIAMDRPVVASDTRAVRRVFDDDALAYFPPGDELALAERVIELHADAEKARRLVEDARRVYEHHRWAIEKRAYVAVHDELLRQIAHLETQLEEAR